jgi:GNAT superfamily N-acetyltransferase
MDDELTMKVVPFAEWRQDIAPLWGMDGAERFISPTIDGFGQMQYFGRERLRSVVCFPIACEVQGERVGWTSIYNVSSEALRVRGIYVMPAFRANGIGFKMVEYGMSLWPLPWKYCFMYARSTNVQRYLKWGFEIAPRHKMRAWEGGLTPGGKRIVLMRKAFRETNDDVRVVPRARPV